MRTLGQPKQGTPLPVKYTSRQHPTVLFRPAPLSRAAGAATLAAMLVLSGCKTSSPTVEAPSTASTPTVHAAFPDGWGSKRRRPPTVEQHAMVVSNSNLASEAGAEILRKGGNAVDAAVATGFALEVTFPFAGNIGGGGFMVIRMANGEASAIDYRETAPLGATRDMYIERGKLTNKSTVGGLASGVPGSVAGMAAALAKYGTMSLHDVMQPAIKLASDGFIVDSATSRGLGASAHLISQFAGAAVFLPGGKPLPPGTLLRQPELAKTLRLIADQGPAAFYTGPIADEIVAQMKHDGGIITRQDLASYRPEWRTPIVGKYRGYTLYAMPPSSAAAAEPMHTTHYSVVDASGNAVSTTTTLNSGFGSGVFVADAGFFMNDEMDDFAAEPGKANQFGLVQGEINAIQPGKRMLSAMSPTIVLDRSGKLLLVVGAAGGPTIITGVTQVILNVIDQHMSLPDAMFAPRMHDQAWPDEITYERGGFSQSATDSLVAMGYKLHEVGGLTNVNAVMRGPDGRWVGVYEPRSNGAA